MAPTDTSNSTSKTLLARVQKLEPQAWDRFLKLYGPLIYGWCVQGGLKSADAADVMQEVFASVFTAIGDFRHDRPEDTLRGWLRVICRHKLHDFYRRRVLQPQSIGGTEATVQLAQIPEPTLDSSSTQDEQQGLVQRAARLVRAEFENQTWQAFWLVVVEHRTAAEAAAKLGMTAGAVRQAKYVVLRRLRAELSDELE